MFQYMQFSIKDIYLNIILREDMFFMLLFATKSVDFTFYIYIYIYTSFTYFSC